MTALPGFIDAHRHVNTGPDEKAQMQALLDAGYTTVLSGGGPRRETSRSAITSTKASSRDRGSSRRAA